MRKLTKVLSVFLIAGAICTGMVTTTGCAHDHTFGDKLEAKDGSQHGYHSTCEHDVWKDLADHVDTDNDGKCDECGGAISKQNPDPDPDPDDDTSIPENEKDRAIVPEYKGEAKGPSAEAQDIVYTLNAADLPSGSLTDAYSDGTYTVPASTEVRDQKTTDGSYTASFKNATVTIKVPSAGKLKVYFSNGSTSKVSSCSITGPSTSETWDSTATAKELVVKELEVTEGTYTLKTTANTINLYKIELALNGVVASPIAGIEVANAGTSDYLITQKVDCTGVKLVAKDGNGVTHDVSLENCKFDTTKYNPKVTGEYEIGVTYYLESNLDSETKQFSTTYKVKVYAVDTIALDTIGLSGSAQVTVQQAFLTTDTFAKDGNLSVIATCELNGKTATFKLKNDWYTVSSVDLSTAGKKTVTVSVNSKYTVGKKEVKSTYEIISAAKKTAQNGKITVTVGTDGEFATLTQAVQFLKKCGLNKGDEKIIEIAPGTYTEKVWIDLDNVTLIGKGENKDATKITYSLVEGDKDSLNGSVWGLNCATVHVKADNFKAYNLSIRNDFDYIANSGNYSGNQAAQGVALTLEGDCAVIANCHLYGNQDTLYMKKGRSYYYNTQIDGNIDFIFGGNTGIGYFEQCTIMAISKTKEGKAQNGYVTAAQHVEASKPDYGYIFAGCTLTADDVVADGSMSLGRTWGAKATVAYINCTISKHYSKLASDASGNDHRWNSMNGAPENADFREFGNTGDGAITEAVKGGSMLTADQAANYTKANIFGTNNGKVGYTVAWDCDAAYAALLALIG